MSLPVPLVVRVGSERVTKQVQSLSFRKEAVGGVRSIAFTLSRGLTDLGGINPLDKVFIDDARSATVIAQGRLTDTGRTASQDGETWDAVAFGPVQHASDITRPKIVVDRTLSDGWQLSDCTSPAASIGMSTSKPDAGTTSPVGILASFPDGTPVVGNSRVCLRYDRLWQSSQVGGRIGFVGANWDAGINEPFWRVEIITGTAGNFITAAAFAGANIAGGSFGAHAGAQFAIGHDTVGLRLIWTGGAATVAGDDKWAWWQEFCLETIRKTKLGADIIGGYTGSTTASAVVADLLGDGWLPQVDNVNANVATTTNVIGQLAYPDGTTAEQILADLMAIEPAFRWYTKPDSTGSGYAFSWEAWPTTVRYEATLDDGGSFPLSAQSVFNRVMVRWVDEGGSTRVTLHSKPCPILDDKGIVRQSLIDLGANVGSYDQAALAASAFLDDHNVPQNSGTLTVARPIRDLLANRMVDPWEIEPGELVRIRGVEAYPDSLNASANDGEGVFRIFAMDYNSEGNTATLALDSDPRDTTDALVRLEKKTQAKFSKR